MFIIEKGTNQTWFVKDGYAYSPSFGQLDPKYLDVARDATEWEVEVFKKALTTMVNARLSSVSWLLEAMMQCGLREEATDLVEYVVDRMLRHE